MAVVSVFSVGGAPGVTVSSLGLALSWPRPVLLVDANPNAGSAVLAGYLRGQMPHDRGLLDLAIAHRAGDLGAAVGATAREIPGSKVRYIPGLRSHVQAPTTTSLWEPLSGVLRSLEQQGMDAIVDCGHLGLVGAPKPIVHTSDVALLTTRTSLPDLSAARSWAKELSGEFQQLGTPDHLGCLVVGEGQPYGHREVQKVLRLPVVSALPWDPETAAVFHHGADAPKRFTNSPLNRGLRATAQAILGLITTNRERLGTHAPSQEPTRA